MRKKRRTNNTRDHKATEPIHLTSRADSLGASLQMKSLPSKTTWCPALQPGSASLRICFAVTQVVDEAPSCHAMARKSFAEQSAGGNSMCGVEGWAQQSRGAATSAKAIIATMAGDKFRTTTANLPAGDWEIVNRNKTIAGAYGREAWTYATASQP